VNGTIGIAGAGVLGRLLAMQLARKGFEVTLFDRDSSQERETCSWVGAGMLAPIAELDVAEPVVARWGLKALEMWPSLVESLDKPVFFQREGSLVVAHRQDLPELERLKRCLSAKWSGPTPFVAKTGANLASLEPDLASRFAHGLFFPEEGQLEPRQLMPALLQAGETAGVTCRFRCHVKKLGQGFIETAGERHPFDWVIDTRGLGARGDVASLRGVRGELLRLHAPEVHLNRPVRLMHPRYPLYIVPRPDRAYLIGATSIESDATDPVTVRSALELLSAAYSVHPGFAEANIVAMQSQVRPALPDNLPRIFSEPGLIRINGLYRHGFLLAPFLAAAAVAFLETGAKLDGETLWSEASHA